MSPSSVTLLPGMFHYTLPLSALDSVPFIAVRAPPRSSARIIPLTHSYPSIAFQSPSKIPCTNDGILVSNQVLLSIFERTRKVDCERSEHYCFVCGGGIICVCSYLFRARKGGLKPSSSWLRRRRAFISCSLYPRIPSFLSATYNTRLYASKPSDNAFLLRNSPYNWAKIGHGG
jgi:hypothetical protein